jgi:hypothetical protein
MRQGGARSVFAPSAGTSMPDSRPRNSRWSAVIVQGPLPEPGLQPDPGKVARTPQERLTALSQHPRVRQGTEEPAVPADDHRVAHLGEHG